MSDLTDRIAHEHHINDYNTDTMTDVCACGTAVVADLEYATHVAEATEQAAREQIVQEVKELPTTRSQSFATGWSSVPLGEVLSIARGGTDV